jgi:aromatic ring-opening dioxygenase catalytic subunit (LigB family)
MSGRRLPTYFLSHGGGPWPYMEAGMRRRFNKLEASLLALRREWGDAVRAVLVISGHWETEEYAVSSAAKPGMVFDYHGFPNICTGSNMTRPARPNLRRACARCCKPAASHVTAMTSAASTTVRSA